MSHPKSQGRPKPHPDKTLLIVLAILAGAVVLVTIFGRIDVGIGGRSGRADVHVETPEADVDGELEVERD